MITLGADAHQRVPGAVARTEPSAQGEELARWAVELGGPRRWGIQGVGNSGCGLAQHPVTSGEAIDEVNPRWTAPGRSARTVGTSNPRDAPPSQGWSSAKAKPSRGEPPETSWRLSAGL